MRLIFKYSNKQYGNQREVKPLFCSLYAAYKTLNTIMYSYQKLLYPKPKLNLGNLGRQYAYSTPPFPLCFFPSRSNFMSHYFNEAISFSVAWTYILGFSKQCVLHLLHNLYKNTAQQYTAMQDFRKYSKPHSHSHNTRKGEERLAIAWEEREQDEICDESMRLKWFDFSSSHLLIPHFLLHLAAEALMQGTLVHSLRIL